jgi:hypothetical protein
VAQSDGGATACFVENGRRYFPSVHAKVSCFRVIGEGLSIFCSFPGHGCLRIGDIGFRLMPRKVSKETVQVINRNIAANSERFIMGPDMAQLQSIVKTSESLDEDTSPRFTIQAEEQDEDGSLQKITFQPRRYFYGKDGAP